RWLQNNLIKSFFPLGFLFLAHILMPLHVLLPQLILDNIQIGPQLLFILALLLGFQYRKQRIFFAALVLLTGYWLLDQQFSTAQDNENISGTMFAAIAIILPLGIAAISTLGDQSVKRINLVVAGGAIVTVITIISWATTQHTEILNSFLFLEVSRGGLLQGTALPQLAIVSFTIALIINGLNFFSKTSVYEGTLLTILIASFIALFNGFNQPETALYMIICGFSLVIAIGETAYTLAYIDELTELPGRRALNETLARIRGKYTLAMLDVDHFKKFNDTYGHDVGDQVLRMVAAKMKQVGGGGKSHRYGGEEFVVVFPGKTSKEAFSHLSMLRETIDNTHMVLRNKDTRPNARPDIKPTKREPWKEVHVTISIGVADNTDDLHTTEQVMKAADKALYRSKEKGRNRISQYGLEFHAQAGQTSPNEKPA
ncbi:MAG: GGDEF domain-containing protein, partial [Gammaproteobacteria bacterium]|nr:GGDEF domain-containing protein [Gammaproteobacteria bacterium]